MMNNFKKLEEEEYEHLAFGSQDIKNNIGSTMDLFRFVTDVVELYVPNILETFVSIVSGKNKPK